jgi:hypothetical protein
MTADWIIAGVRATVLYFPTPGEGVDVESTPVSVTKLGRLFAYTSSGALFDLDTRRVDSYGRTVYPDPPGRVLVEPDHPIAHEADARKETTTT